MADTPETLDLLKAIEHLLEGMRRLTMLAERLAYRAALSEREGQDVERELTTARDHVTQLDAMVTLWRQGSRPM